MDYFYYILNAVIFILLLTRARNSIKIEVKSAMQLRFFMPSIVIAVAIFVWFSYEGMFRILQTFFLIIFAIEFYFMYSGLSAKGVVVSGKLYTYDKLHDFKIDNTRKCLIYHRRMADVMYFKESDLETVKKYLEEHKVHLS